MIPLDDIGVEFLLRLLLLSLLFARALGRVSRRSCCICLSICSILFSSQEVEEGADETLFICGQLLTSMILSAKTAFPFKSEFDACKIALTCDGSLFNQRVPSNCSLICEPPKCLISFNNCVGFRSPNSISERSFRIFSCYDAPYLSNRTVLRLRYLSVSGG